MSWTSWCTDQVKISWVTTAGNYVIAKTWVTNPFQFKKPENPSWIDFNLKNKTICFQDSYLFETDLSEKGAKTLLKMHSKKTILKLKNKEVTKSISIRNLDAP